jgi:hypothetical protein
MRRAFFVGLKSVFDGSGLDDGLYIGLGFLGAAFLALLNLFVVAGTEATPQSAPPSLTGWDAYVAGVCGQLCGILILFAVIAALMYTGC